MTANLAALPSFGPGGRIHVVVESPKGSRVKLKYDPALQVFAYSRPLPQGLCYPFDWGFVPSTLGPDGDPVDALILHDAPTHPGTVVPCRPLGVLQVSQTEKGEVRRNDRLMFQPIGDPSEEDVADVRDLSARAKTQLEMFFAAATFGTGKRLEFLGWRGADSARHLVEAGAKSWTRSGETSAVRRR